MSYGFGIIEIMEENKDKSPSTREENLLVVVAVEEYSRRHGVTAQETLGLFQKFGIIESIRQCYDTLHTQDIYECVEFAEDIIRRKSA